MGLEETKNEIIKEFQNTASELKEVVKDQERQIGEVQKGLRSSIDESVAESIQEYNSKMEDLVKQQEEITRELNEMKAEGGRVLPGSAHRKNVGAEVVQSDEFQRFIKRGARGESDQIAFEGFGGFTKTLTSDEGPAYGQMGHLIQPQELGVIEGPERVNDIRQLIPTIRTNSDTVSYIKELGYANLYTELDAPALSSATTITVKSTAGLFVGQEIFLAPAADPENTVSKIISAINQTTRVVTITAATGTAFAAGDPVTAEAIGMTPHGAQKPEASLLGFTEESYPIGTVAHYMVAHRQTLADAPQLQGLINNRLLSGLDLSVELQLLYGNGTSPNLRGIMNLADTQVHPNFAGTKDANGVWRLDHVRRAITRAQVSQFPPSAFLVNPYDWQEIELAKGTDNHYVWVTVVEGGVERLWRLNVRVTTSIRQGEFLMGAFDRGVYLLNREDANVRIADQHKDFFTSNMVAILAEERLGSAPIRPQAFVKGTFN
jgi:HK97 family phage major capsid protein